MESIVNNLESRYLSIIVTPDLANLLSCLVGLQEKDFGSFPPESLSTYPGAGTSLDRGYKTFPIPFNKLVQK